MTTLHIMTAKDRETMAQKVVAGHNPVTRQADLRVARGTIDAIDAAFARGVSDRAIRAARIAEKAARSAYEAGIGA